MFIYRPKGKALEYGELALNIYKGCDHGCVYCYAPAVTRCSSDNFSNVQVRKGLIDGLAKELKGSYLKEIFLCFTCDPYSKFAAGSGVTRQVISMLKAYGINVNILSKGGERSLSDIDLLGKGDKFGATLTFKDEGKSLVWEPNAALPNGRFSALRQAHLFGLDTWASLEPVIDPEESLACIEETIGYVRTYKLGKWNHDKRAAGINWGKYVRRALNLLDAAGANYYIKDDLKPYI